MDLFSQKTLKRKQNTDLVAMTPRDLFEDAVTFLINLSRGSAWKKNYVSFLTLLCCRLLSLKCTMEFTSAQVLL